MRNGATGTGRTHGQFHTQPPYGDVHRMKVSCLAYETTRYLADAAMGVVSPFPRRSAR